MPGNVTIDTSKPFVRDGDGNVTIEGTCRYGTTITVTIDGQAKPPVACKTSNTWSITTHISTGPYNVTASDGSEGNDSENITVSNPPH